MRTATRVHLRWQIKRDLPEVLAIESQCFSHPWDEDCFIRCLRQRNAIGMVAEHDEKIVGYMQYQLHKSRLHILNFAVHPDFQRQGVGATMAHKLIGKLAPQRRSRIRIEVRETNLDAQLFFKQMGFRAISILNDFYDDTDEAAYLMEYRLEDE